MKQIEVHITEKDKGAKGLSLFNLKEEVVNFLYKDTVGNSTKLDLQFYFLLFFASVKVENKSHLERIFDEAIPKFTKLNEAFTNKKGKLRAGEYRQLIESHGLSELFERDIFFILAEAVMNLDEIKQLFSGFYSEHKELSVVMDIMNKEYAPKLRASFKSFKASVIQDDRYDEFGNYHDLSKSVYRTAVMRKSRNFDVNLQKYTSLKKLTSESPIDLNIIQSIDPQIIIDLWDKYQVAHYMKSLWHFADDSQIVSGVIGGLVVKYVGWKKTKGTTNPKEKKLAKESYEVARAVASPDLEALAANLTESVLKSDEKLAAEIKLQNKRLSKMQNKADRDEGEIKRLKKRVGRLENLEIETKIIDGVDHGRPSRKKVNADDDDDKTT